MIRNRKAKNSLPLPSGYVPVNMGHYRTPGKKLNGLGKLFNCLSFSIKLSLRAFWLLCLIFGNDENRGSRTAKNSSGMVGLRGSSFTNRHEYQKYLQQQKW